MLILEQEVFLGTLLSERFRRSGFSVELLTDVPPGGLAESETFDLIVVGTLRPGALARLGGRVTETPTIILGEPQEGFPAWPFPTLDKPFSPNQLVDLAGRYLLAQKLHEQELKGGAAQLGTIPIS